VDADAFEVVFQTCAALVGKVVVDEERREGGFVERRVGQCGDGEGEIPAERLSARGGIEGVPVRLFVERIRDLEDVNFVPSNVGSRWSYRNVKIPIRLVPGSSSRFVNIYLNISPQALAKENRNALSRRARTLTS
jgi:hypothetical protein